MSDRIPIRRALVSVYDKTGLDELVRGLHEAGVELVSTGGSAARIDDARPAGDQGRGPHRLPRVPRRPGQDAAPDGARRHPRRPRGSSPTSQQLAELGIEPFDLVVSNLYPFAQTVASGASPDECVEQIDIGGPSMVRAAAKNHPSVAIVTSPDALRRGARRARGRRLHPRRSASAWPPRPSRTPRRTTSRWRRGWAACSPTPATATGFPAFDRRDLGAKAAVLRYGENPHQPAALYAPLARRARRRPSSCTARRCPTTTTSTPTPPAAPPTTSTEPTVAIIKHANPCGIAIGADVAEAHRKAHACDPVSAFGGVIAVNRPVSMAMAEQVAEVFTEVIVAPAYEDGAVEVLQAQEEHPDPALRRRRAPRPRGVPRDLRRRADAARRPRRRPRRRPGDLDARHRRGRRPTTCSPTSLRLAGLPLGEVQRDPARPRRRLGRHRHGPGQPGRLLPARRRAGGGAGGRLGRGVRRVLPVRGRARRC